MSDAVANPTDVVPASWREVLDAVTAFVLVAEEDGVLLYANHAAATSIAAAPGRCVQELTAEADLAWSCAPAEHEGRQYTIFTGTRPEDLRFRQILETAPHGLAIGCATRITWANPALATLHGYTREEVLSLPLTALFVPDARQEVTAILETLGSGHRSWESVLLRKDGSTFPARVEAWSAGNGLCSFAWVEDTDPTIVTQAQRVVAEAGQLLSESLEVRAILDRLADLCARLLADVTIVDIRTEDGNIWRAAVRSRDADQQWIAHALQHVPLDRTRPHLVGEVLTSWGPALVVDVTEAHLAAWSQSPAYEAILRALRPRTLLGVPLLARGELLGAITLVRTERMPRFTGSELRLADAIASWAALAVANARLYDATKRAVEQRDDVLKMVAHDLRGPVSTCAMAAQHLARQLPPDLHHAHGVLDTIRRSAQRGSRLIDDLLRHGVAVTPSPHPVAPLLAQAASFLRPLAEEARLSLEVDVDEEVPAVQVDRDRLFQILGNLVDNAVKHTPSGGRVVLRARRSGAHVVFSVTDTGRGLPEAQRSRAFDRGWQADPTKGGAGLGLSIARRLVEAHGGHIWIDSQPGAGTSVSFTVPLA